MNKKAVVLAIFISLLLAWGIYCHYIPTVPPAPATREPQTVLPPPANTTANSRKEEPVRPKENQTKNKEAIESISIDKATVPKNQPRDLSVYSMSIKKEEKKALEIMKGVKVESKAVHIQLDEDDNQYIEIEKNPSDSNNQYQMLLRKNF